MRCLICRNRPRKKDEFPAWEGSGQFVHLVHGVPAVLCPEHLLAWHRFITDQPALEKYRDAIDEWDMMIAKMQGGDTFGLSWQRDIAEERRTACRAVWTLAVQWLEDQIEKAKAEKPPETDKTAT